MLVDQIELDGLLGEKYWYTPVEDNANRLVMLSLAMLYAGMCPLATVIIFIYQLIQNKFDETNAYWF